jgi:nucleotide-binding universal stress UspA family protein
VGLLLATKGSSGDELSLRLVAEIAGAAGEPVTILTVVKQEADRLQAGAILARAGGFLTRQGIAARTSLRVGHVATEIVREAEEGDYALVIVSTGQERNLAKRLLHGSTMVRVVEHAPCPVIVTKDKARPIRRILLCDSGASYALATTNTSNAIPSLLGRFIAQPADLLAREAEIVVLHVMSQISAGPGVSGKQLRSNAEDLIQEHAPEGELLEADIRGLERLGIRARAEVRHGFVVDEILAEARHGDYDLVVIGAYRGQGWQRILLDDQAHRIIVQMDRPVLVLR